MTTVDLEPPYSSVTDRLLFGYMNSPASLWQNVYLLHEDVPWHLIRCPYAQTPDEQRQSHA